MNLGQLRYFVVAAELENLSLAASRLRIAQSAISRQVRLLEEELGVQLLERVGRGVKLTDAGKTLLDRGRLLLGQVRQLEVDIKTRGGAPDGILRIGANPSFGEIILPQIASLCREFLPNVTLHFVTDLAATMLDSVRRGSLDFAIISFPDKDADFILEPLVTESIFLISHIEHDPGFADECTLRAVSKLPLLLPAYPNRERLGYERVAAAKGFTLNCIIESDSLSVLKSLAARKLGHMLLPSIATASDAPAGQWKLSCVKGLTVERYIVRGARRPLSKAATAVIKLVHEETKQLRLRGIIR